eukprot:scaffold129040_cov37-Tisochrysis_lutea.AAC.2
MAATVSTPKAATPGLRARQNRILPKMKWRSEELEMRFESYDSTRNSLKCVALDAFKARRGLNTIYLIVNGHGREIDLIQEP